MSNKVQDKVIITGYRACGKTTVGKLLADRLHFEFIDTDKLIEQREGCTIKGMVDKKGWPYFREKERLVLEELIGADNIVAATGGGAIMQQGAWQRLMESSLSVWLYADPKIICERIAADRVTEEQRPTLTGAGILEEVDTVLKERVPLYEKGSHLALDTGKNSPEELAAIIEKNFKKTKK